MQPCKLKKILLSRDGFFVHLEYNIVRERERECRRCEKGDTKAAVGFDTEPRFQQSVSQSLRQRRQGYNDTCIYRYKVGFAGL